MIIFYSTCYKFLTVSVIFFVGTLFIFWYVFTAHRMAIKNNVNDATHDENGIKNRYNKSSERKEKTIKNENKAK